MGTALHGTGSMHAGLLVLSQDRRVLFANAPCAALLQHPQESLRGQDLSELVPAAVWDPLFRSAEEQMGREFSDVVEVANGALSQRVHATVSRAAQNGATQFMVCLEPLAGADAAAETGERDEIERLRRALDHLPLEIVYIDADLRYRMVNQAFERRHGREGRSVIGRRVESVLGAGFFQRIKPHLERALQGQNVNFEIQREFENGSLRTLWVNYIPDVDEDRKVNGLYAAVQDVTSLKQAQLRLRESESQLRAVVEAEPECIKLIDAKGRLTHMNPAGLAMLDVDSFDEIADVDPFAFVVEEYREPYRELFTRAFKGETGKMVLEIQGRRGSRRHVESTVVPVCDDRGKIGSVLSVTRDVSDRKRAEDQLYYLSHFDHLTGLPNRFLFVERLEQAVDESRAKERLVGVLFLDIDHFKNINDTLGHEMGDALLKNVADRLVDLVVPPATVAHLGGDEFGIILPGIPHIDHVTGMAYAILTQFTTPFRVTEREFFLTASIGLTVYPFDDRGVEGLLKNADAAMYQAKQEGRNTYRIYEASIRERVNKRLTLESKMRNALEKEQFELFYQPQVDLRTGRICGAEALLRWNEPETGMISPVDFIPVAEDSGLIVPIGRWVLRQACEQARAWQHAGFPPFPLAVNLSVRQIRQRNLVNVVIWALKEADLDPRWLELEITESLFMEDQTATLELMNEIKEIGIQFALDDFGTGYSSLSYLKRFPIDCLKIDRSFIKDIPDDEDDSAIASTIITMAHSLNMHVVAEGVETVQQLNFLRAEGCEAMQGYYFSPPVPAAELTHMFKAGKSLQD